MRTFLVAMFALAAAVCAGVWALAEFGGGMIQTVDAPREPLVREAQAIAPRSASTDLESIPAPALPATDDNAEEDVSVQPADPEMSLALQADEPRARIQGAPVETERMLQSAAASAMTPPSLTSEFKARTITYNRPPQKLILDRPINVSLVINATDDADAGRDSLQGFPGTVVERDVELSDTVSAQLTGVGFDIVSQSVERQRLSSRAVNRWQWRVTPTETGTRTLILEIFGYESGSLDAEPLDAYRDDIVVEVQQLDQLIKWAQGVQPIFAVLAGIAGALSALFAFLRFRTEKKRR